MGLLKDIKAEWTWEDIKADFKEHWPDFVAISLAAGFTPTVRRWLGWEENAWAYLAVWIVIAVSTGVVVGLIRGIIKRINKEL